MADPDERLARWIEVSGDEDAQWARTVPGPSIAAVAARVSSVPRQYLDDRVDLIALAADTFTGHVGSPACLAFAPTREVRLGAAVGLWLVASEELLEPLVPRLAGGRSPAAAVLAVDALALRTASASDPLDWLSDDARREEAARTYLLWCGHLPAGEDAATARSTLDALDSLAQDRALAEAYAEHRHRAEVARRLAEARAKEAAARYTRE